MNIIERYHEFQSAKVFNDADIKGILTVSGYSFDIRLINKDLYANSLPLEDFFKEALLTVDEQIVYEEAIYDWLSQLSKSQVA